MNEFVIVQRHPGPKVISQQEINGNPRNNTLHRSEPSIQDHVILLYIGLESGGHNKVIDHSRYAACSHVCCVFVHEFIDTYSQLYGFHNKSIIT